VFDRKYSQLTVLKADELQPIPHAVSGRLKYETDSKKVNN